MFSLRARLLISIWLVLILTLFMPAWRHYDKLKSEVLSESQSDAIKQLHSIGRMLNEREPFASVEQLRAWMAEVGKQMDVRITYMSDDGQIIADSQVPISRISDAQSFPTRPEILQTRDQEVGLSIRFSRTLNQELIFSAKKMSSRGAVPSGILRLAAPFSHTRDMLVRLKNTYLILFTLILVAASLLSFLIIRQLGYPIRAMMKAAEAIGNGNFKQRVRFRPGQVFYPLAQAFNRMADNIDVHIQAIHEQQQQLEAVFNGMQEGVMVLDSRGRIQTFNRAFSGLISNPSQVIGRRPLEAIMNLELQKACDRVLGGSGREETGPNNLQISISNERIHNVNIVRLEDEEERGIGAVVVFHDISELKRLERVRQDFVANVSHELRTPLTSIKGYAETLLTESREKPEMVDSFLQVILKNTNHMVKMVDDLLRLSRLEAPTKPIEPAPVNASNALAAAWKACAPLAEEQSIHFKNDVPEDVRVLADHDQLVQVFRNLLENAVKYSPTGGTVAVSCRAQRDSIRFAVRDQGPGISGQHQQRIFERFYRVEKHRSSHSGSTGLGLAICRHIIRNHGGTIWVQSPNNDDLTGTTVYFTLLQAPAEQKEMADAGSASLDKQVV
jgi:two-component system phosphate regulon sensor histidine kinase PhoR